MRARRCWCRAAPTCWRRGGCRRAVSLHRLRAIRALWQVTSEHREDMPMTTMNAALGAGLLALALGAHAEPGVSRDMIKLGSYLPLQSVLAAGAMQLKEGTVASFKCGND